MLQPTRVSPKALKVVHCSGDISKELWVYGTEISRTACYNRHTSATRLINCRLHEVTEDNGDLQLVIMTLLVWALTIS